MYCIIPCSAPFIISYLICNSKMNLNLIASCLLFLMLQAIKVLNMIKLYGKPIRVNKVHFFISILCARTCVFRYLSIKPANVEMLVIQTLLFPFEWNYCFKLFYFIQVHSIIYNIFTYW
jgi:hypothetical protein